MTFAAHRGLQRTFNELMPNEAGKWKVERLPIAILFISLALSLCLWLLFSFTLPGTTRFWRAAQDSGHSLIFFGLSLCLLLLYRFIIVNERKIQASLFIFIFIPLFGAAIEIVQPKMGRSASWTDFFMDLGGSVAAISLYLALGKRLLIKSIFLAVALATIIFCFREPLRLWGLEKMRDAHLPNLSDFEAPWSQTFIGSIYSAKMNVEPAPNTWKNNKSLVAKLEFRPGSWPGIALKEPPLNWEPYQYVSFDVFNPDALDRKIVVRIHDGQHNEVHEDRFNRTFNISQGEAKITIDLRAVKRAPKNREMDMQDIQMMVIYAVRPKQTFTLYFDNFELQ